MSPAGARHGFIAARLSLSIGAFAEAHDLGRIFAAETGFRLASDPDTVRAPDVAFIRGERATVVAREPGFPHGAPDLAVEVLSPSDAPSEVREKTAAWLEAGALAVMVVDPDAGTVTIDHRDGSRTLFGSRDIVVLPDLLPGWSTAVADLLRP